MPSLIIEVLTNSSFVFWGAVTLICVVPSICHYWYKVRCHELNLALKQSMIEQGFSAEEIIRVLEAGPKAQSEA